MVILRQRISRRFNAESSAELSIRFLLLRMIRILAFSKVLRFAIFKKFLNSVLELLPAPSAILFDMDIPAPRSCSANRYNFFSSSLSAMSNKLFPISIASSQIFKFWNLNLTICLLYYPLAPSPTRKIIWIGFRRLEFLINSAKFLFIELCQVNRQKVFLVSLVSLVSFVSFVTDLTIQLVHKLIVF